MIYDPHIIGLGAIPVVTGLLLFAYTRSWQQALYWTCMIALCVVGVAVFS